MSAKHTPGPWVVCAEEGDERAFTVFPESMLVNGLIRAQDWDRQVAAAGLDQPEYEANARLISAAPTMLHALRVAKLSIQEVIKGYQAALVYEKDCGHQDSLAAFQGELDTINDAITLATGERA